jgi:hypothetical protein
MKSAAVARGIVIGALLVACSDVDVDALAPSPSTAPSANSPGSVNTSGSMHASGAILEDASVLGWITQHCGGAPGCHGPKSDGRLDMTWPMPPRLTREWLEVTDSTAVAYELMLRKLEGTGASRFPSPMPPDSLDAEGMRELQGVVAWFEANLPLSVEAAALRFGRARSLAMGPPPRFACQAPASVRTFMTRLTRRALGRAPSAAELGEFSATPDAAISASQRSAVVAKLRAGWKAEFLGTGLRTLVDTIATAGRVPYPGVAGPEGTREPLPVEVTRDLGGDVPSEELYRLVLAHYDTWSYAEYLSAGTVMATRNTAPLYGCAVTPDWQNGEWRECPLAPPRKGFFTTLGYLNLIQQSFVNSAQGSRRFSGMYFTIMGEGPARTGAFGPPAGAIPDCMESTDTRIHKVGQYEVGGGVAHILGLGEICRSCHMRRGVAAGMLLFRPFSTTGKAYAADTLGTAGMDLADVQSALDGTWTYQGQTLSLDVLQGLLAFSKACITPDDPTRAFVSLSSVADLAAYLANQHGALARGFARHAHRAFSSAPLIPLEAMIAVTDAFDAGRTKIPDIVTAYFGAESFACGEEL